MLIRKALLTDKDQLLKLLNKFGDFYIENKIFPDEFLPFVEYKNRDTLFDKVIDKYLSGHNFITFVAEEDDKLIGYICGLVKDNPPRILDKEGFIEDWFILEEYRGKGIGKQLYDAILQEFKNAECNYLKLEAYASNKSVIDIYHKMGFIDSELVLVKKI